MKQIFIGDTEEIYDLYLIIKNKMYRSNKENLYDVKFIEKNNTKYIECNVKENKKLDMDYKEMINFFSYTLAETVTDYIINNKGNKYLKTIIDKDYSFFNPKEKSKILDFSLKILEKKYDLKYGNTIYNYRLKMINEIIEYLKSHDEIILNGFFRFRLKYFIKDLKYIVDAGVEEFLMEREYNEFVRLLQYFVDIQEPKIETLHIVIGEGEYFTLLDTNCNPIENDYLEDLVTEFLEDEIKFEDLLISSLITIAPNKIYLHNIDGISNKKIMETIKKIFVDKVILCEGCGICKGNKIKENILKGEHQSR